MHIEVFSDAICPWCWIGKRRLAKALEAPDLADTTVTWRAFQLYPELPADGMPRTEFQRLRWGISPDDPRADPANNPAWQRIRAEGDGEGLTFNFGRAERVPNTLQAHRLLRWAHVEAGNAGQDRLLEALFAAYFTDGRDIGERTVLAAVAGESGFDADAAQAFLAGDLGTAEVQHEVQWSRENGITGVPCFVLPNGYGIPGAQDAETLAQVLRRGKQVIADAAAADA